MFIPASVQGVPGERGGWGAWAESDCPMGSTWSAGGAETGQCFLGDLGCLGGLPKASALGVRPQGTPEAPWQDGGLERGIVGGEKWVSPETLRCRHLTFGRRVTLDWTVRGMRLEGFSSSSFRGWKPGSWGVSGGQREPLMALEQGGGQISASERKAGPEGLA